MHAMHFLRSIEKLPNLELKTRLKQLLGYLLFAFVLPVLSASCSRMHFWDQETYPAKKLDKFM